MSSSLDDLNVMKPEIEKLKEENIISIGMPYKHYIQEALTITHWFKEFKPELEEGGTDYKNVEKLESILGACRELFSHMSVTLSNSGAQAEWTAASDEADEIMYDLKEAMYFAFRNSPELLSKLSYLRQGGSNADLFQDLNDFATLGRDNKELLTGIGYDLANVERAAELSKKMADLYAQVTIDRSKSPEFTVLRDKSFTMLKKSIDELNLQARYIFRANKTKAAIFTIRPPKKKALKKVVEAETTVA
jgi:hypothetical protein